MMMLTQISHEYESLLFLAVPLRSPRRGGAPCHVPQTLG